MRTRYRILLVALLLVGGAMGVLTTTDWGRSAQFVMGGALVNMGYRMQDHLVSYDFKDEHEHDISPEQVWAEMVNQNALAAGVRNVFPRSSRHPLVAVVVCMDARLDTNELTGDTRKYYYVIRTAGSVLDDKEIEMLELAVEKGVKVIVLSAHSDCAAEHAAGDPQLRARFPALTKAILERGARLRDLMARPVIAERLRKGTLAVKSIDIDTMTEKMLPR